MSDVAWGPTGREIFERTYARPTADGREEWAQTVARVVDGNLALVDPRYVREGEREALIHLIQDFQLMPAGRHLWVSGVEGRQFLFNCHRAGFTGRLADHVGFTFDELMKGGGIGANYSSEYVHRQAEVWRAPRVFIVCDTDHPNVDEVEPDVYSVDSIVPFQLPDRYWIEVEDSREGWVHALSAICDYADGTDYFSDLPLYINVSRVRGRGEPIKGFGGTACGPGPLAQMLRSIAGILNDAEGRKLTGMEMMKIDHEIASCVVAGNVRRSARMSIMHWNDPHIFRFINCKALDGEHWSTNISVEIDDAFWAAFESEDEATRSHARRVFEKVTEGMLHNGEPGFFNSSLASRDELGDVRCTNPCGEIALEEWENCNLGHINLARCEDLHDAAEWMTRFLIRATFGDIESELQREVVDRNRRIGVGFYGFQEWLHDEWGRRWSEFDEDVSRGLAAVKRTIGKAARDYAHQLRIPVPIKTTTVAPTGTIAKLSGHTEGMHPVYARWYERRVRYAADDARLHELDEVLLVEDCIYSAGTTVVGFLCEDTIIAGRRPELIETPDELSVDTMMRVQAEVQRAWADNAVSFTANVLPDTSIDELRMALIRWLPELKGTTIMPDASRPQAPYTRLTKSEFDHAAEFTPPQSYAMAEACSTGACPVK